MANRGALSARHPTRHGIGVSLPISSLVLEAAAHAVGRNPDDRQRGTRSYNHRTQASRGYIPRASSRKTAGTTTAGSLLRETSREEREQTRFEPLSQPVRVAAVVF